MRKISVITVLSLSLSSSLLAQEATKFKLVDDPVYKEGISAMTDHLPTIAIKRFTDLLASRAEEIDEQAKLKLLFLLAESQIRAVLPGDALITLSDPLISSHPDSIFWKGQALATAGRYNDAIQILEKAEPKSKHYQLAQIKIAYLAAALSDIDKAIAILSKYTANNNQSTTHPPELYLSLANLYIAKKDPVNARKVLEKTPKMGEQQSKVKKVIQAQIAILDEAYPDAISTLADLIESSEILDRSTLGYATLYLSDALMLIGNKQDAIDTIVDYLDQNPSSLILGPMFTRLGEWIPKETAITDPTIKKLITWAGRDREGSTSAPPPTIQNEETEDLRAFAHYYYARFLAAQDETASKTRAIFEFNLLRIRYPTHILAGSSLTDTASTQLALERIEPAKETLKLIQRLNIPIAPIAKQQAAFLLGKLNIDEKNYSDAAVAFQNVVDSAQKGSHLQTAATINAASAYLSAANTDGFEKLNQKIDDTVIKNNLLLEYALWLANENKSSARRILHEFTIKHPDHPRTVEAKLALAHHCLRVAPVDLNLCQSIIPGISSEELSSDQRADYSYLIYRNATTTKNYPEAANTAKDFIDNFPSHPRVVEFTLLLGQALYHNGQHNNARTILLNLVSAHPQHPLKSYAEYYAAMSAKLEGTPQSQDEAILLFKKIAADDSPIKLESLIQLAKLYTDKNLPQQAINALKPEYDAEPEGKKSLRIAIALAKAYHAQADSNTENFQSALNIFDSLIKQYKGDPKSTNQIKYYKALTLQHMEKDDEALETYYSVINMDTGKTPINEWEFYYKCGFTAIKMLEEMKNPNGAIAIAKKLATSNGNRAEEAKKRARDLEMKYMIWQQ